MKRRFGPDTPSVTIDFEGESLPALEGEPVASALIAADKPILSRSVKYHRPRGAYCFASSCSQCLMRIDGVPNVFACQAKVKPGMRIERQNAFPSADVDVFSVTDWIFPKGFDHHHLFAGVPLAQDIMLKVARQLAGLGLLPDKAAQSAATLPDEKTHILIVGAGPAGVAAAQECLAERVPFLLIDAEPAVDVSGVPQEALRLSTTAIGVYPSEEGRFLAVVEDRSLRRIFAKGFLFCNGGHPAMVPFENGDIPGVYSGHALKTLLEKHHVLPGERVALFGDATFRALLSESLNQAGAEVVVSIDDFPLRASGIQRVKAVTCMSNSGAEQVFDCDVVGVCAPLAPNFELARQAGADVAFDEASGVFKVLADTAGATAAHNVFVAGTVRGPLSEQEASLQGRQAAVALISRLRGGA